MLKILYAASDNENSLIQLSRFLKAIEGKPYIVKIAAYKKSSPKNVSIDWNLDCLKNIFKPEQVSKNNDNFTTYFEQVKYYNPDLIISDLEYYTSYIADVLNITLWQCSSFLIAFALGRGAVSNTGFTKHYSYLTKRGGERNEITYLLNNSNCNFVYSHFGDLPNSPELKSNFEWIRPYHEVGKNYIPCSHNVVAGLLKNNKNIFHLLKKYPDSVAFTNFYEENYANLQLKDIDNFEEYKCNLYNSKLFVCEGQTSFLADAFYNNKYSVVMMNLKDPECVINSLFSEKLQLSHTIYDAKEDLSQYFDLSIQNSYNKQIKYLHEKLDEI